jgi:glycosyltransferase involved in cell wall biosynthesis
MRIIITSPSLDSRKNVGGMSSVVSLIISNNKECCYSHFELGKRDTEKRSVFYFLRILKSWGHWSAIMLFRRDLFVHFNIALEKRSVIRDCPLIIFAHILRKKMVIHVHGGYYMVNDNAPAWISKTLRFVLSGREPKIVLSEKEKEVITSRFSASNVFVLPNSLDLTDARVFTRDFQGEGVVNLLFIGRIVTDKGIEYILKALTELKEKGVKFRFLMAGDGAEREEYVRRFSDALGSSFEYRGVVSGSTKSDLFKECQIFLLPSFYEGLPVSLLESMSFAEVPVITDVGSVRTVVKDGVNGIIIRKYSSDDISEAVMRLINEKGLLETIATNAQNNVFENFNPEKYIEELNRIYQKA